MSSIFFILLPILAGVIIAFAYLTMAVVELIRDNIERKHNEDKIIK